VTPFSNGKIEAVGAEHIPRKPATCIETANIGAQQQFLPRRQSVANAHTDQRVEPIHIAAPGNGPAAGDDQATDVQVTHQAKIDVQVLVPIASARPSRSTAV
jgi:hypothetical protein